MMRIVIVGAGEVGRHLGRSLQNEADLILIDPDARELASAEEGLDALTLVGDGTHRSVLRKAEVERADLFIAVTPDDSVNLVSAALARDLGATRAVARVDDPAFYESKRGFESGVLGIEASVCASRLVGVELLRMLAAVRARQVVACAAGRVQVASHVIGEDSPLLAGSRARATTWPEPIRAIVRAGQLRSSAEIEHAELGDVVLMACSPLGLLELLHELTPAAGVMRTTIVGGGDVGIQLAGLLGPRGLLDRLIESDRSRCWSLAEQLHGVQILHGDGTNIAFLREEHVGRVDALLAVTGSDEANLMTSLLARELGVDHVFALVHRPGYAGVYSHLGVSGTASPHETIARVIRGLMPRGTIVGRSSLSEIAVDLVELRPGVADVRVADLPLPPGAIPLVIAGRSIRAPKPRATLAADDVLVVALPGGRVGMLEKALRRKPIGGAA
ncbi:Trk system potassium uptake protein TrkA [Enhygromyxa salina]|uniref:Trk system potassium uptake protein TrkA n=1 Tax=Enhygromyxa salina TaxID=215803 RepID=A0A2S9XB20_9BACT|nr:Trk system potassium transporter TrkA [Enhygromyxa salina]PRP90049.1 Trk system potassium uptake protein TrkA [Enhygromyxa salina]